MAASRVGRNAVNNPKRARNSRERDKNSLKPGRNNRERDNSGPKRGSSSRNPSRRNLNREHAPRRSSNSRDRHPNNRFHRNGRNSPENAISSNGNPEFARRNRLRLSGSDHRNARRSRRGNSRSNGLRSQGDHRRIAPRSRLGNGSNSADGSSEAPGRDITAGKTIALETGHPNIARGHSGAVTGVITFRGISSACILARGTIFSSTPGR